MMEVKLISKVVYIVKGFDVLDGEYNATDFESTWECIKERDDNNLSIMTYTQSYDRGDDILIAINIHIVKD